MDSIIERLLTVTEAAKLLRISKSQLYLLIEQRRIPHIRLTQKRVVIRETDLISWLQKHLVDTS
jgi:excisionase family DNA binding protein